MTNRFNDLGDGHQLRYRVDIDGLRGAAETPAGAVCAALSAGGKIHAGMRDGKAVAAFLIWNYQPSPSWLELIQVLEHNEFPPPPHRDIDTIDEYHDLGMRDLTDPFTGAPR